MTSQDAVWLTPDLPVERRSMHRRPGDPPTGNARAVKVVVVVSFGCALIIHVACGCLIEMNILLLLITAIARVMEHLAVLPG